MNKAAKQIAKNGGSVDLSDSVVLMDLDVSVYSARKALTPEDIGKTKADIPEEFYLGHQALLPKCALKFGRTLENRGRSVLDKYGSIFPVGQTRAIPLAVLPQVEAELADLQKKFVEWFEDTLLPKYPEYLEAMVAKFGEQLRKFYLTEKALRDRFAYEWVTINISLPKGNDENAKKVRGRIEAWVDQVALDLRSAASETLSTLASNLGSDKPAAIASISDSRMKKIRETLNRIRSCNFISDAKMDSILDEAEKLLEKKDTADLRSDEKSRHSMRAALGKLVDSLKGGEVAAVTTAFKRKL